MNNQSAISLIEDCKSDLERISLIIEVLGSTNRAIPFLTKYSIIKVCGTLEQCFKIIISDYSTNQQNQQIKNYINITFRESSINPNLDNIYKSLSKFDTNWKNNFKQNINANTNKVRILDSIKSLNNARNEFAHGGNPQTTFNDVENYFVDAKTIIEYIDASVT
ncbi:RiboL-PSP-HEPN [Flavobacteriaceae bacterium]|jgi:hypothetical protein